MLADVTVLFVTYSKFWDGIKNFIQSMWQVAFANIPAQSTAVHSYIYSFFYGSSHIVPLPANNFDVIHHFCVASSASVLKYR